MEHEIKPIEEQTMRDITSMPNDYIVIHIKTDTICEHYSNDDVVYVVDTKRIPLVRCKECRYWEMRNSPRGWCVVHQGYVSPQYFCADGERKTNDRN